MITVTFCSRGETLAGFTVAGHSGYAAAGSDIICASVSSCALMVANTVTDVMRLEAEAEADDNGFLRLMISEAPERAQDLLRGFRLHMTELAKDYPQYVLCKTIQL